MIFRQSSITFKGKDRDPHLAETLTHEYEGILQWIVGMFGDLEIVVDPHTKLNENLLRIASFMEVDLGLRHVESFAAMNDAITS